MSLPHKKGCPQKVKATIKKNIALEQESRLQTHAQTIVKQGNLLSVAILENMNNKKKITFFI